MHLHQKRCSPLAREGLGQKSENIIAPEKWVSVEMRNLDLLTETYEVIEILENMFGGLSDT